MQQVDLAAGRRRSSLARRAGVRSAITAAAAAAVGLTFGWVFLHARSELRSMRATPFGDAIVVFGAAVSDGRPAPELRSRLDHAAGLWHAGRAPEVIVSGGEDEMPVMRDYLVARGIPVAAITDGRPGFNTRATVATMARLDRGRYVAVSSAYHSFRIESECRRQGVAVECSAPPPTRALRRPRVHTVRFVTELIGSVWYALPAWITRRVRPGQLRHTLPGLLAGDRGEVPGWVAGAVRAGGRD